MASIKRHRLGRSQVEKADAAPNEVRMSGMKELGATGLTHWGGLIDEEWMRALRGDRRWKVYREMRENDPIVAAVRFAIDMLIRQVRWSLSPAVANDQAAQDVSDFVNSCLYDMSTTWENTLTEILSFLDYGFAYHEIVYKKRVGPSQKDPSRRSKHTDGKIGWRKLAPRSQDTLYKWEIDDTGGVQGFWQRDPNGYQEVLIPIQKALLFRTTTHKGNPEGRSILRGAYRPWYFKKRIEEIEGIGVERDLAGLPVMYVPAQIMTSDASADEQALYTQMKKIIRNVRRDEQEGVLLPGDADEKGNRLFQLELLTTGGTRQFNTSEIIGRYSQHITMTVLADFVLLGHEKVGSFALSSDKTNMFAVAIGAWLDEVGSVMNRHAIPRLLEMNGMNLELAPELVHGDIETPDLKDLAEYISKLSAAGMTLFPDDNLENVLRSYAGLPEKPDQDDAAPPDVGQEEDDEQGAAMMD